MAKENLHDFHMVTKKFPRPDAISKVTGLTCFCGDFEFPGMLYGTVLNSRVPRARIISVDTTAAEDLPGVVRVFTAKDLLQEDRS